MSNLLIATLIWPCCTLRAASARSLYVDRFVNILGDEHKERELLEYSKTHKVDTLLLYDLFKIFDKYSSSASSTLLERFVTKAKTIYNIQMVGVVGETSVIFKNHVDPYNNLCRDATSKFDIYNMEFEFWLDPPTGPGGYYCKTYLLPNGLKCDRHGAFAFYLQELRAIKSIAGANRHKIRTETYVGWPTREEAMQLQPVLDRVLLHAYRKTQTDTYQYTKSRLIGFAANNASMDVSIIFSMEPDFMQAWLEGHSMREAESFYLQSYSGDVGEDAPNIKRYIKLKPFTYFAYTMGTKIAL